MLYAVAGGQGSGKSTVLNELATKHGFRVIERKTSRSILAEWNVSLSQINNDRQLTQRFQEEILKRKWDDEVAAIESDEIVLTERTYIDLFVYALVAIGKDNEYSNWLDMYYERCFRNQLAYKGVFYLPTGHFRPVDDGVRAINQHYQGMVDRTMQHYMKQFPEVHSIDTLLLSDRTNAIVDIIQQDQQNRLVIDPLKIRSNAILDIVLNREDV